MKSLGFVLAFSLVLCSIESFAVERCRARRIEDNENSLGSSSLSGNGESSGRATLSRQNLKTLASSNFESFKKSQTAILDVSLNQIASIANGTFRSFFNLRVLSMRFNQLRQINATSFDELMSLEELDLSSNAISEVDRDAFRSLLNLRTIDLSVNCIVRLPNYVFFRNVRLINIHLKRNQLSEVPILMPTQQFVENFNVSGNHFTNITSLLKYNNIQSLDLSDNPLVSEEMKATSADMAREDDHDDSSSSEDPHLRIKYNTGSKIAYFPSPSSSSTPRPTPPTGRRGNRDRIDFSSDVNFVATSRARVNTSGDEFTRNIDFLTNTFRSHRTSEKALEDFIKSTMEQKPPNIKVTDMIRVLNTISDFYRTQNRQALRDELEAMKSERRFDVASFLQWLKDLIKSGSTRTARHTNNNRARIAPVQIQQLIRASQINHLEYFTCRNCSLQSMDFLANFPELQSIDVSFNQIKSVNEAKLASSLRYLFISDNELEALHFESMLVSWPNFRALIANENAKLNCDLIAQMQYKVAHLNRAFRLEVNKCK